MSEQSNQRAGLILAGGYSRRFGHVEKALVRIDGRPMIDRVVDAVGAVTAVVIVNCRSEQRRQFTRALDDRSTHLAFAIDPVEDAGPLVGLAAGLAVHEAPVTLVASCDQPFLESVVLNHLCRELESNDAIVPVLDGTPQRTPIVLDTEQALKVACDRLRAGDRSISSLLDRLEVRKIAERSLAEWGNPACLRDIDSPAELQANFDRDLK